MSGLLTHWLNEKAKNAAFKLFLTRLWPVRQANLGTVKPGWEKLPPMPKEGSTYLKDCAI